jgi:hypothetical protein
MADDPRAPGTVVFPVLLEHPSELLANELRARDAFLPRRMREQAIKLGIENYCPGLLLSRCHTGDSTQLPAAYSGSTAIVCFTGVTAARASSWSVF